MKARLFLAVLSCWAVATQAQRSPFDYVNPLLGTATIWDAKDVGYTPTHRTWGAEVFPGASRPNAMVQLTPVTKFHSGSGYQYEDTTIYGFAHTSKGHWNLCYIPLLPATTGFTADDYASAYSHDRESAHPAYYQVYLQRYDVNAELTSTLRCGFHRYTFKAGQPENVIADLSESNERVHGWNIHQEDAHVFTGYQHAGEKMYFYAVANHRIARIDSLQGRKKVVPVLHFENGAGPLELRIGFSFVSIRNAKENLEREIGTSVFESVREGGVNAWNTLLSKIKVTGGTERQRGLFYSCLYRSFLWPALRSDINGDFTNNKGEVVNKGFDYYTEPSLWDDYRNKLVLLGLLEPKVTANVIQSLIDKGEKTGFMPTFFHGDHAAAFVAGSYLRGIRGYDVQRAYQQLLRNATVEGGTRPYITEYATRGYIAEKEVEHPVIETVTKAAVTKTLEYAYDDYALAQLAHSLGDTANYRMLMKRTGNYKNVFDPSTRFMRGRLENGGWVKNFNPDYPYYEYMYREANAWQSSFFAPHDMEGLVKLFPSKQAFEQKVDSLFSYPWQGYEAYNISGFIGQYTQGNQPDHSYPFLYYFVGKQEKSQVILDSILNHFYDMGKEHLAYSGMDDAGENSSWYVFNAMGFYPFSPADPKYIVSVPLFDKVEMKLDNGKTFTVVKQGKGRKITRLDVSGKKISDYYLQDADLKQGKTLTVRTR